METSEGTDHEDTCTETVPEAVETDVLVDGANGSSLLVHDRDHGVCGVGDNSAEDTSPVAGQEGNTELLGLAVGVAGLGEDVGVEESYCLFEGDELDNGVRDLSAPEGDDTLVEAVPALSVHDLGPAFSQVGGELSFVGGLNSDFDLNERNKSYY